MDKASLSHSEKEILIFNFNQRLFTAPHRWGWRDRVATRTDLNPDPHPLA